MDDKFTVVISQSELDKFLSLKKFLDKYSSCDDFSSLPDDYFEKVIDYAFVRSSIGIKCMSQIQERLENGNAFD